MEFVLDMNLHEFLYWIAEDIDRSKLEAELRKPKR